MRIEEVQTRVAAPYAAGTATVNGNGIDCANYEWAKFAVSFGAIAASAVTSVKLQGSDDNSSFSDLEGTAQTVEADDDSQVFVLGLTKPRHRYNRVVVVKDASNSVAASATVELGGGRTQQALASVTDEVTVEVSHSPASGTA